MLNELCRLSNSLEIAGIAPKDWHPQLKPLPKADIKRPCYKIEINEKSKIKSITPISLDLIPKLRKWEPSNGNSFPGFNLQPLYRITGDDEKKLLSHWKNGKEKIDFNLLYSWLVPSNKNWDKKNYQKLTKCLFETPKELYKKINSVSEDPTADSILKLIARISNIPINLRGSDGDSYFRKMIEEFIVSALKAGEAPLFLLGFLIHMGDGGKKAESDRGVLSIFADIPDWVDFPVASPETIDVLNTALHSTSSNLRSTPRNDAFGSPMIGTEEKLPAVRLPVIADVKLRAMSGENPCQKRYGAIDAASFPIGKISRTRTKGALEWLGDPSREGETWGRADNSELVFAYPEILPPMPVKLASCFGAHIPAESEMPFAHAATDVIAALKGMVKGHRNLEIQVFSLKKMDKARTKIVFYRNYSAHRLIGAATDWQIGAANIPDITIRVKGERGAFLLLSPITPYPLQIAQCLNRIWKLDGTSNDQIEIVKPAHGIELLLEEKQQRFIAYLLSIAIKNGKGLLLSVGGEINRGQLSYIKGYCSHKILLPPIIGILLYKLGIGKESYMANVPFLVGKMLKLADELHAVYCKEVRDGNMPPQLIGNSLMTAALDSPLQALAQLALRLKPYYGWAQTFRSKENGALVGYFIRLYGEIAFELENMKFPARFNDSERAQLLLGYLAAHAKKDEKNININLSKEPANA